LGIVSGAAHILINSHMIPLFDFMSAVTLGEVPVIGVIAAISTLIMKTLALPWIVYVCIFEEHSWTRWLKLTAFGVTSLTALIGFLVSGAEIPGWFIPTASAVMSPLVWSVSILWYALDAIVNLGFGITTMVSSRWMEPPRASGWERSST
jgi:hypothetical protein